MAVGVTEATRQWCEERGHPFVTYNPWLDDSWCRCGACRVPGEQPLDEPCRCYVP